MGERRPLVAGVRPAETAAPAVEKQFVFGGTAALPAPREEGGRSSVGRLPLSTRVRADYAAALKRASLERQLAGQVPNTLQDILEEALGPWLRAHGYVE